MLLNINGQPTYFMALKDSAGLAKKFAMLDIQRYQNVAVGDTVSECQKTYKALLATNGALEGSDVADDSLLKTSGTIKVMTEAVIDGNSHFYLTLDGVSGVFDCALPGQLEVVAYSVGDKITLEYIEGDPTNSVQSIGGSSADDKKDEKDATDEEEEAQSA